MSSNRNISDEQRRKVTAEIHTDISKLLNDLQVVMKDGMEKSVTLQKLVETSMWLRLYMEIENIKPEVRVAIGTKPGNA